MTSIRLAPEAPDSLGIDDALDAARSAYSEARAAQRRIVYVAGELLDTIYRGGSVNYARLKRERREAEAQVTQACAVLDALTRAIGAMEATR